MNIRTIMVYLVAIALALAAIPSTHAQSRPDALELYRQGLYPQAVAVTQEELAENPANLDAYTVLGWSLLALGRYQEALEFGSQGLSVSRFDHRIVNIVGESHFRLGNTLEALGFMQDYTALAPNGSLIDEAYFVIGEIHIELEEYHHADIALTTAVLFNSDRAAWWSRLGFAREMAGSREFAGAAYREALERNPGLIDAQRGLDRVTASISG